MKVKIALYQSRLKGYVPKSIIKKLIKKSPDFFALPEYFFTNKNVAKLSEMHSDSDSNISYLKKLSSKLPNTVIIGGAMITKENDKYYNSTYVIKNENIIGVYHKNKLFGKEFGDITPANEMKVFDVEGVKFSVLICADVLDESHFEKLKSLNTKIIFAPTFSPYKEEKPLEKKVRDKNIFQKGANVINGFVIKICGVPTDGIYRIQGRSLIASKDRILWRVPFHREDEEILKISNINIDES